MYFRGNSYFSAEGISTPKDIGLILSGSSDTPTRLSYRFKTRIMRQVFGLRGGAEDEGEGCLRVFLDGQSAGEICLKGTSLQTEVLSLDIPRADSHEITLLHEGPAPIFVRELILRWRGQSEDPVGDEIQVEEGRFWDAYFRVHVGEGDVSILDGEVPATHPSFLNLGIRVPDTRDIDREFGWQSPWAARFLLEPFRERRGGRGLDLGCGGGAYSLQAARQGIRMMGIDLGAGMLRLGREYAAKQQDIQIDYVRAEASHLPFRPDCFDVVASKDALHHVAEVQVGFNEICRVLKPDGIFVALEHVSESQVVNRCLHWIQGIFRRLILRRYSIGPAPGELHYGSPLEDAGAGQIVKIFENCFHRRRKKAYFLLVEYAWMHAHYAFGRMRWFFVPLTKAVAGMVEGLIVAFKGPVSVCLRGEGKR